MPRPVTPARAPRRGARTAALALVLLLALPLLAGCLQAQLTMAVSTDDEVSGRLVIAVPDGAQAPTVAVPPSLSSKVTAEAYAQSGYTGTLVLFDALTFAQVSQLSSLTPTGQGQYSLTLRRSGDIVTLEGTLDLTSVTAAGADVVLKINFPAAVTTTNGVRAGDNGVSWSIADGPLVVGANNPLQATVRYADPGSRSFTDWSLLLGGLVGGVALLVAIIALLARDRSPRPGRVRT